MKNAIAIALGFALVAPVAAQDAVTAVPESYKHQFENEWVRIVRVHYPPHAKLPAHTHTSLACAYVYLNDSGPVIFARCVRQERELSKQHTILSSRRTSRPALVNTRY
jgi:hypothetical protein